MTARTIGVAVADEESLAIAEELREIRAASQRRLAADGIHTYEDALPRMSHWAKPVRLGR